MTVTRRHLLAGLGALALAPWVGGVARASRADTPRLETTTLVIHGRQGPERLTVEVAKSAPQRAQGLMGRERLARDAGMLFLYEQRQPPGSGFWMYRTLIPLDIAFIAADGRIVAIERMTPCGSTSPGDCRAYRAGVDYRAALEVNAGYFAARGIRVGDCVSLPGRAGTCSP